MDPTHFGAVRHYYQHAAELLLDGMAELTYPEINEKDLRSFRETYGASAYVCRFLHCVFSSDGFESSSQRARHESQHQRHFRCAHSSCVHFARGFVSRNLLNKHNENYHPVVVEGPSLAESLALPPAVERPAQAATEMIQQGIDFPQTRGMPRPSAPATGVAANSRTQPSSPQQNPVPLTPRMMEFAPSNSSLDVFQDFNFDSFLQNGWVEENFNVDTSAFLDENTIGAE
jgi:hypothetical protein